MQLEHLASVSRMQSPFLSLSLLSGTESLRYRAQYQMKNPVYILSVLIIVGLAGTYIVYRQLQQRIANERDRQAVDTSTHAGVKPLRRTAEPIIGHTVNALVDKVATAILPTDDDVFSEVNLDKLDEVNLEHELYQASHLGGGATSYGGLDLPIGCKHSKGLARFPYHEAKSVFHYLVGFHLPNEAEITREGNSEAKELDVKRLEMLEEIQQFKKTLLEMVQYFGFTVEGTQGAYHVSVNPVHRIVDDYASWNLMDDKSTRDDQATRTDLVIQFVITFDRPLEDLPENVREFLYTESMKYEELFKLYLPEVTKLSQFKLNKIRGAPAPLPKLNQKDRPQFMKV